MKDLFTLDSIIGASSKVRSDRKEQVQAVQNMLGHLDSVQYRLKDLLKEINAKKESVPQQQNKVDTEKVEKKESPTPQEQSKVDTPVDHERAKPPTPPIVRKTFRDMKLTPKFEVRQSPDAYVICSYIPGMKSEDVVVSLRGDQNDLLSIRGFRGPTKTEEEAMKRHLRSLNISEYANEDDALLLWGAGRFGSFSEVYRLAEDVIVEEVAATYERGVLKVVLPRRRKVRRGGEFPWGYPQGYNDEPMYEPRYERGYEPKFGRGYEPRLEREYEPRFEREYEPRYDGRRRQAMNRGGFGGMPLGGDLWW